MFGLDGSHIYRWTISTSVQGFKLRLLESLVNGVWRASLTLYSSMNLVYIQVIH
jgi:hypothetical protein